MRDLEVDTLADAHALMALPPGLRRGNTRLLTGQPNPAAGANLAYPISNDYWERVLSVFAVLTTSAVAGVRVPSLTYVNADGTPFATVPLDLAVPASSAVTISADVFGSSSPVAGPSAAGEGAVTNPAGGATIAATAAVPAGTYTVSGTVYVSGTVTAADGNNMQVTGTGAAPVKLAYPGVASTVATFTATITTTGAGTIQVVAIGAASGAAATYNASIVVTAVAAGAVRALLPGFILRSGWAVQLNIAGIAAGDQISSVAILAERYPSNWAIGSLGSDEEQQHRDLAAMIAEQLRGPW